jgi:hypothetical protein
MTLDSSSDDETHAIVYDGRLVALAGPRRCHLLSDDLEPAEMRIVTAMCLCSREVREGRVPGPFTSELAERWRRPAVCVARTSVRARRRRSTRSTWCSSRAMRSGTLTCRAREC